MHNQYKNRLLVRVVETQCSVLNRKRIKYTTSSHSAWVYQHLYFFRSDLKEKRSNLTARGLGLKRRRKRSLTTIEIKWSLCVWPLTCHVPMNLAIGAKCSLRVFSLPHRHGVLFYCLLVGSLLLLTCCLFSNFLPRFSLIKTNKRILSILFSSSSPLNSTHSLGLVWFPAILQSALVLVLDLELSLVEAGPSQVEAKKWKEEDEEWRERKERTKPQSHCLFYTIFFLVSQDLSRQLSLFRTLLPKEMSR